MNRILLAFALMMTPAVAAAQQLQSLEIPGSVRDFTFGSPHVLFDRDLRMRGMRRHKDYEVEDKSRGVVVAEKHVYRSHMGQVTVTTPQASREMPQPGFAVTFSVDFPSTAVDVDAAYRNAVAFFGVRHAPSCEDDNHVQFHYDENWLPVAGNCDIDPFEYFGANTEAVTRAVLDGKVARYILYIGIWDDRKKHTDKYLQVGFQDNLRRARHEAALLGYR